MNQSDKVIEAKKVKENLKNIIKGEFFVLRNSKTGKLDIVIFDKEDNQLNPFTAAIHREDETMLYLTNINEDHIDIISTGIARATLTEEFLISC